MNAERPNAAWEKVKLARHPKRPTALALIARLFPDFIELHGDRAFGDDPAVIGGIASFDGRPVTVIAQEKGTNTDDKIHRNFGMPHPEGYRKALRLMLQAERFHRPIVTIIDTPGAYPGIGAEERGQASAIATNLREMMSIKTPVVVIVLGEGGSGGALGIGVGDRVAMFENATYSILSPEGFAAILYKDAEQAPAAASLMKLTAADLFTLHVVDEVMPEGPGLHEDPSTGFVAVQGYLSRALVALSCLPVDRLLSERYIKFRAIGAIVDGENGRSTDENQN
ncbi:MAG TPA: acetyl-CoA carboxylase carboxyl transferase subunit alpha [Acholeplasmatales bacterium]|nr:MAG: acetyl-CoA carboxylase carboxyltransferase subunit alpha [Tenericutes bacterium GWF2_57_13]HAQ56205.1 acetyl-CoA carboxylase carboxyl transferase subunit alpha [Acholeplasmatales bacterium]